MRTQSERKVNIQVSSSALNEFKSCTNKIFIHIRIDSIDTFILYLQLNQ